MFGGTQPALPARGSAAKTIICDRSARDDSLPHDSLMPSNDQNRKKLTGRRVKVSERGTKTQKEREIDYIPEWGKKQSECAMKVQDVKCVELSKTLTRTPLTRNFDSISFPAPLSVTDTRGRVCLSVMIMLAASQRTIIVVIVC